MPVPEWLFILIIFVISIGMAFILVPSIQNKPYYKVFFILFCASIITMSYFFWGGSKEVFRFHKEEKERQQVKRMLQSNPGREQIINAMRIKLEQDPESSKGWYLLGRLYAGEGRWLEARDAFLQAIVLDKDNEAYQVNYTQSLWQLNNQKFNESIRKKFKALLSKNPKQPDSLAMLAMDSFQQKNYEQAILYWETLLSIMPPDTEDAFAVRKAIAKAQQSMPVKN